MCSKRKEKSLKSEAPPLPPPEGEVVPGCTQPGTERGVILRRRSRRRILSPAGARALSCCGKTDPAPSGSFACAQDDKRGEEQILRRSKTPRGLVSSGCCKAFPAPGRGVAQRRRGAALPPRRGKNKSFRRILGVVRIRRAIFVYRPFSAGRGQAAAPTALSHIIFSCQALLPVLGIHIQYSCAMRLD